MDKYAQLKKFHHDLRVQFYMYDFMYVGPGTMSVEDHFPDTKKMLRTTVKCQLQDQSQNICLGLVT